MAQTEQTVQVVQNLAELKGLKRQDLVKMVKQFKEEDTDCLQDVNGKSKNDEIIEALAEYMGLSESVETEIQSEVNKEIEKQVDMQDVMDFGEDVPTFEDKVEIITVGEAPKLEEISAEDILEVETTGDAEVDSVLAELGLDGLTDMEPADILTPEQVQTIEDENIEPVAEEKPKKERAKRATIPMDAPIPVRQYENLILGIYGNILEEREEPFPEDHKYAGCKYEEIKLERFNAKAHETFRKTKGNMHLLYTNASSTYLIVMKKADGTIEPVLEVTNKGRGCYRCKQLANTLQVAYNEKKDQEIISAEEYSKLAEQIELMPINMESVGA